MASGLLRASMRAMMTATWAAVVYSTAGLEASPEVRACVTFAITGWARVATWVVSQALAKKGGKHGKSRA